MSASVVRLQQPEARQAPDRGGRRSGASRRRSTAQWVVLPCVASALALALTSTAAAAAVEVYKQSFREQTVSAYASTQDGCTSTSTTVDAGATRVVYTHFTYDACTGEATALLGSAPPTTFDVRGNLSTAHLVATVPLTNLGTGEPAGQVVIDDTWTATQQATKGKYSYSTNTPGEYRYSSRSAANQAPATVTGTVAFDYGYIWKVTMMEISVTHV